MDGNYNYQSYIVVTFEKEWITITFASYTNNDYWNYFENIAETIIMFSLG